MTKKEIIALMESIKRKAIYLSQCNPEEIDVEKLKKVNEVLGTNWEVDEDGELIILKR